MANFIVQGGRGGRMPDDYARQGSNPDATLTDTQAYAQAAAADAAAAKDAAQTLSPVALAADAYNTGKVELAANISAKGVQASASETLPQLAQKVTAIAQQPIILSPSEVGDMYAKQLYGSLTIPNYWNLYEVLNTLLNDGRLLNYGGILLAEYYKGYDSIALSGAGAGGAYVVSDMENGVFKMYTEDTTHVWNTEFNGKGNRWVAYCFADEYHDYQITDTNTSPRSIFIGRKVGTITSLVNGRCSQIVVMDGSELSGISGNYAQSWDKKVVMRNIGNVTLYNPPSESVYIESNGSVRIYGDAGLSSIIIKNKNSSPLSQIFEDNTSRSSIGYFYVESDTISCPFGAFVRCGSGCNVIIRARYIKDGNLPSFILGSNAKSLYLYDIDKKDGAVYLATGSITLNYLYIGYPSNYDKTQTISIPIYLNYSVSGLTKVELQNGYCKKLNISQLLGSVEEANIYTYILQRLKQDEPDCGDGVTITLGSTNLAKLTSEESVQLLDDLTNIYGYTFA